MKSTEMSFEGPYSGDILEQIAGECFASLACSKCEVAEMAIILTKDGKGMRAAVRCDTCGHTEYAGEMDLRNVDKQFITVMWALGSPPPKLPNDDERWERI